MIVDAPEGITSAMLGRLYVDAEVGICLCRLLRDDSGRVSGLTVIDGNPVFVALAERAPRTADDALGFPSVEGDSLELYASAASGLRQSFTGYAPELSEWLRVTAVPAGPADHVILMIRDVTPERRAADALRGELYHAETRLTDLNHRMMNSLSMIASIIAMEKRARAEGAGLQVLERIEGRVRAVADLCRILLTSGDAPEIQADDYLARVIASASDSIGSRDGIELDTDLAPLIHSSHTVTLLGLIANELLTNAFKYAFAEGDRGRISVRLLAEDGKTVLIVSDDGRGMHRTGSGNADGEQSGGIGHRIVRAFVSQLGGEVVTDSARTGTCITVRIEGAGKPASPPA
ncbi:sensor histidine kinase [Roseicyclus sp. F158]|uniref:histidine kinase n=1 Tax=Tropicimonas omnivorans TaxID=3075590 RepID=A0ABU3DFN0_9RHOB|nr:sensor histidine kinase [Roseicyclus sp. F158]MDT0682518.1 sensor histidine kinase [Roseicyclus sp. F158]